MTEDYIRGTRKADPTPEEIAAMCLLIQSEWDETERMRRRGGCLHPEYRYKPQREKSEQNSLADEFSD